MSTQQPPVYEVFFTGKDDPRDGCVVIGEDTKPIFYRFETPPAYVGNPRTTVSYPSSFFFPPSSPSLGVGAFDLIYPLLDNLSSIPPSPPRRLPFPFTHEKVYRNAGEIVACMDWSGGGYQLGGLTIANRQSPMTRFVMHGSTDK